MTPEKHNFNLSMNEVNVPYASLFFVEEILIFNFETKVCDTSNGTPFFNSSTYEITLVCKEPTCTTSTSNQEIQNSYPTYIYSAVLFHHNYR
jgi:hypothetical protein